jgi:hypothetical protein
MRKAAMALRIFKGIFNKLFSRMKLGGFALLRPCVKNLSPDNSQADIPPRIERD